METGKRPSSHGKKVGQGSVNVNKTDKVETGGQQVGSGGRPSSAGGYRPAAGGPRRGITRAAGGGSTLLLVALAVLLLRACGSSGADTGYYTDNSSGGGQTVVATAVPTQAPVVTAAPAPTAAPQASVAANARAKRYTPKAGDSVTIMVYMCGTDLESSYGMATSDLQEMASATIGSNVNVLVETGGCKLWKNRIVSASTNQIYKVETGGVRLVNGNVGSKPMVSTDTLTEFIQFCSTNYPADRNILIFWDHGGGSISGYGYDELFKSAGSMDLAEISTALKAAGRTFDWIGFDACLMATLETALVCNDYADYLIASEESEPGTGWYYTNWLTMLSQNTAVDTVTLGKKLVDDFVATSTAASSGAKVTLSVVDLAEMQGAVPTALNSFATDMASRISGGDYATVSTARAGARQFAQSSRINQIDLMDFANRMGTAQGQTLIQALQSCIKYNKSTISKAYGLSIYFPYETTSSVKTALSTYKKVGMDEAYTKCVSSFASLASSGQLGAAAGSYGSGMDISSLLGSYLGSGGSGSSSYSGSGGYGAANSLLGALMGGYTNSSGQSAAGSSVGADTMMQLISALAGSGRSLPADMDWLDTDLVADQAEYVSSNYIDPGTLVVSILSDGTRGLTLTDEQWALIESLELNVFVDDGAGFLDMGLDNVFEWEDDNTARLDWDGTWMTVNGHAAAFYMDSSDDDMTTGHIPARLTQTLPVEYPLAGEGGQSSQGMTVTQLVYLDVLFDQAHPDGVITGARPMYEDETDTVAKGDIQIRKGDVLEFLADYYAYDGTFESAYRLGDPMTVDGELEIVYYALRDVKASVTYRLTDIYGSHYWLPAWTA